MLDLITAVSPQAVRHALDTRAPLWGVLYFRVSNCAFPDEGWTDAINMCLPKWLADARTLTYGLVDEIREEFVDEAPRFTFRVRFTRPGHVNLTCLEWDQQVADSLELPLSSYTSALVRAGRTVLQQIEPVSGPTNSLVEELHRSTAFFAP